jgi:hypothetical protein
VACPSKNEGDLAETTDENEARPEGEPSMHFGDTYGEILSTAVQMIALLAIPSLTVLAYRSWTSRWRSELPDWRGVLGLISILMTSLGLLAFVSLFLAVLLRINLNADYCLVFEILTLTLGIPSALALKGPSRPQILSADLMMILLLWATINV